MEKIGVVDCEVEISVQEDYLKVLLELVSVEKRLTAGLGRGREWTAMKT